MALYFGNGTLRQGQLWRNGTDLGALERVSTRGVWILTAEGSPELQLRVFGVGWHQKRGGIARVSAQARQRDPLPGQESVASAAAPCRRLRRGKPGWAFAALLADRHNQPDVERGASLYQFRPDAPATKFGNEGLAHAKIRVCLFRV